MNEDGEFYKKMQELEKMVDEEFDKKMQELEKMVDDLCDSDGNSRVIALKSKILELLEKSHKIGWNHATENCCGCLDFL